MSARPAASLFERVRQALRGLFERLRGATRDAQYLQRAPRRARGRRRRGLLDHDMRVGAADAEGAHAGAPRSRERPGPRLAREIERARLERQRGIGLPEGSVGRDHAVLDRQHRLDQAGHARRGVEVADVALHRAQRAVAARLRRAPECLGECRDLDRVAERRSGAVRLGVADGPGRNAGEGVGLRDHGRLSRHARRGVADLVRAVVVDRRSRDHGVHGIALGDAHPRGASTGPCPRRCPAPCPRPARRTGGNGHRPRGCRPRDAGSRAAAGRSRPRHRRAPCRTAARAAPGRPSAPRRGTSSRRSAR